MSSAPNGLWLKLGVPAKKFLGPARLSLSRSPSSTSMALHPPFLRASLSFWTWSLKRRVQLFASADLPRLSVSSLPLESPSVGNCRASAWLASEAGCVWTLRSLVMSSSLLS